MKLVAVNDKIELYVNDKLIGHAREDFVYSGSIGFIAVSYVNETTQIAFDNLRITAP